MQDTLKSDGKTSERRAREQQRRKSKAYVRSEQQVHVQVGLGSDDDVQTLSPEKG
jgi:hypothetical protein